MPVVGIDIAKLTFEAAWWVDGRWKTQSFKNDTEGFAKLKNLLGEKHHVCLEATGRYGSSLALSLFEAGHDVSVVNPLRIKRYSESRLRRTKTDRADAILIAEFCDKERPGPWMPLATEVEELRELVRRREHVLGMQQMERNRNLAGPVSASVAASIERSLVFWREELERVEKAIEAHFKANSDLNDQRKLLVSIPGLGSLSAAILLAEIGDISQFASAKHLAAFAGLVPNERSSGTSVRGRAGIGKMGNPRIRRVLYMATLSAKRCNPPIREFCENLLKTKPGRVVHVAAMRKLIHQAYGVLKHQRPFDPNAANPPRREERELPSS
ncbi:Transposase IS116/IS110/IS902 family protein [compost metagenome]